MSRHNVVYVEACSFDNPLGGFVPGTKSTNKILRRSLLCKSRNNRLIRPSIPRLLSGESSRKYFSTLGSILFRQSSRQRSFILGTCIDIKACFHLADKSEVPQVILKYFYFANGYLLCKLAG